MAFFVISLVVLVTSSCGDTKDIGLPAEPPLDLQVARFQASSTVFAYDAYIRNDTSPLSESESSGFLQVGDYRDEEFGNLYAEGYFNLRLSPASVDSVQWADTSLGYQLDSISLSMFVSNGNELGEFTSDVRFQLYALTEDLPQLTRVSTDKIAYDVSQPVGTGVLPEGEDSLGITLSQDYVSTFSLTELERLNDLSEAAFLQEQKGFALVPDFTDQRIFVVYLLSSESRVNFHFSSPSIDTTGAILPPITLTNVLDYRFNGYHYSYFEHDFSAASSPISQLTTQPSINQDTSGYLMSGNGLGSVLNFGTNLDSFITSSQSTIEIISAQILINGAVEEVNLPPQLTLSTISPTEDLPATNLEIQNLLQNAGVFTVGGFLDSARKFTFRRTDQTTIFAMDITQSFQRDFIDPGTTGQRILIAIDKSAILPAAFRFSSTQAPSAATLEVFYLEKPLN